MAFVLAAAVPSHSADVRETKLLAAFDGLKNGTVSQSKAKDDCILTLPNVNAGRGLRQIASGFFETTSGLALIRLCEAWVAAVMADSLSTETLRIVVLEEADDRTLARAVGDMLRASYLATLSMPETPSAEAN